MNQPLPVVPNKTHNLPSQVTAHWNLRFPPQAAGLFGNRWTALARKPGLASQILKWSFRWCLCCQQLCWLVIDKVWRKTLVACLSRALGRSGTFKTAEKKVGTRSSKTTLRPNPRVSLGWSIRFSWLSNVPQHNYAKRRSYCPWSWANWRDYCLYLSWIIYIVVKCSSIYDRHVRWPTIVLNHFNNVNSFGVQSFRTGSHGSQKCFFLAKSNWDTPRISG